MAGQPEHSPSLALEVEAATEDQIGLISTSAESSLQSASIWAFSALLNISDIMIVPPRIHWPAPPNSGWLNCAMLLWPLPRG